RAGSRDGVPHVPASIEETGWGVEALAGFLAASHGRSVLSPTQTKAALESGAAWLIEKVETDHWKTPAPIGFYFAKLWYFEQLYPIIFTVGALNRALAALHSVTPREGTRPTGNPNAA